jgi:hypothetical protein
VSATQLYFLAAADGEAARWLAHVVAGAKRRQWFTEQADLSIASVERFGLSASEVSSIQEELRLAVAAWCGQFRYGFPAAPARNLSPSTRRKADTLVLERTTKGSPKAWSIGCDSPEEERAYRELLYENNLDLLFHRIFYWADGKRSLMEIIERLEFEMKDLQDDTSISRTSSGFAIQESPSPELNVEAVLHRVLRPQPTIPRVSGESIHPCRKDTLCGERCNRKRP